MNLEWTFDWLAHFLTGSESVVFLCVVIIFIALRSAGWLYVRTRERKRGIDKAIEVLADIEDESQFAKSFETIQRQLSDNVAIGSAWQEFTESLILPAGSDNKSQLITNTIDPTDYFSIATIVEPKLNLRLANSIPNMLTGLGILFTFLGLACGIYLASDSIQATSQLEMLTALNSLLGGAALAFWTSICGLVCSLTFNFWEKRRIQGLQSSLSQFNSKLNSLMDRTTEEKIAHELWQESKRQTKQLERFNTDLAISIAEALDKKLVENIKPTMESLTRTMTEFVAGQSSQTTDTMQAMVGEFKESLMEGTKTEMQKVSENLGQLSQSIQQTVTDLSQAGAGAGAALKEASQAVTDDMQRLMRDSLEALDAQRSRSDEAMNASIGRMMEHMEQIAELVDEATRHFDSRLRESVTASGDIMAASAERVEQELRQAAGHLNNLMVAIAGQIGRFREVVDSLGEFADRSAKANSQLQEASTGLEALLDSIYRASDPILSASKKLMAVSESFDSAIREVKGLTDAIRYAEERLGETTARLAEQWQSIGRRYDGLDQSLGAVFAEFQAGASKYSDSVRKTIEELDHQFAEAVSKLSGAIAEFNEEYGGLEAAISELGTKLELLTPPSSQAS